MKHYTGFALQLEEGNTNVKNVTNMKNGLGTHTTTSSPSQPCVSDLKFETDSEAGLRHRDGSSKSFKSQCQARVISHARPSGGYY